MNRNIILAYFLSAMKNAWFWLGIWVFYYLKFTDYAGIGLIETAGIAVGTLGEIPTGAIADLFGKKKTLILSFFLEAIGSYLMAFGQNFYHIFVAVIIMWTGGVLYSGTLDALVFDSLKQNNQESKFAKTIANLSSVILITIALVSILGGFMYVYDSRLPFLAHAFLLTLGLIACFFLKEPLIDSVKFSFSNYFIQTKQGFSQLFASINRRQTIKLLLLGFFIVILDEILEPILLVEYGFEPQWLGIIYSAIYLLAAAASQLTPWFNKRLNLISVIIGLSLIIAPAAGLVFGGLTVLLRYNLAPIFNNLASAAINQNTLSKYRATTISTFNMLKNLPYVLSAFFIGSLMDIISAKVFALYLGLALLGLLLLQKHTLDKKKSIR